MSNAHNNKTSQYDGDGEKNRVRVKVKVKANLILKMQ